MKKSSKHEFVVNLNLTYYRLNGTNVNCHHKYYLSDWLLRVFVFFFINKCRPPTMQQGPIINRISIVSIIIIGHHVILKYYFYSRYLRKFDDLSTAEGWTFTNNYKFFCCWFSFGANTYNLKVSS